MGWEKRNKHKYYYRKTRDGDKVRSEYLGNNLHSYIYSGYLHKQKIQNQKIQAQIKTEEAKERELNDIHQLLIALAEASLLLNGYHMHKGEWRKKRETHRTD